MSFFYKSCSNISHCHFWEENFYPQEWFFECLKCHQFSNNILQGKEIELMSVEINMLNITEVDLGKATNLVC